MADAGTKLLSVGESLKSAIALVRYQNQQKLLASYSVCHKRLLPMA